MFILILHRLLQANKEKQSKKLLIEFIKFSPVSHLRSLIFKKEILLIRKLFCVVFIFALMSCTATGPVFEQLSNTPPDLATIYIYHPKDAQYLNDEANFLFYQGKQVFRFTHGGYTYFQVEPGVHEFQIRLSTFFVATDLVRDQVAIEAKAGQTYFIKYVEELGGVEYWSTGNMAGASRLTDANIQQVDNSVGLSEIASMKLLTHNLGLRI